MHGRVLVRTGKVNEKLFDYFEEVRALMSHPVSWQSAASKCVEKHFESVCAKVGAKHIFASFKR
jgi:hypothetical protein